MSELRESNIMQTLGKIHSDIAVIQKDCEWMKQSLENTKKALDEKQKDNKDKFASKWVEKPIMLMMLGAVAWVANQLLQLIPTVSALIN